MSVITNLRNEAIKPRHWTLIEECLGQKLPDENANPEEGEVQTLTLSLLDEWEAFNHTEEIEEISGQASGEAALEIMLKKVKFSIFDGIFFNENLRWKTRGKQPNL